MKMFFQASTKILLSFMISLSYNFDTLLCKCWNKKVNFFTFWSKFVKLSIL